MANTTLDDFVGLYKLVSDDLQMVDEKSVPKLETAITAALTKNTQLQIKRLQSRLDTLRAHKNDYPADFDVRVAALQDQINQLQAKPPDDTPAPAPNEHGGIPQPHVVAEDTPTQPVEPRQPRKRRKRGQADNG